MIQDFTEAIEKNPADIYWYIARGLVLLVLGKNGLALKDFQISVRVDPKLKQPLDRCSIDGPEKICRIWN